MLDKRQEEIDSLLKLYTDQATRDYHTSMLDKERLLLYAHLSQQQAIQSLELHGRLAESMDKSNLLIEKTLGDRLEDTNEKLNRAIRLIMKQNQDVISSMLLEATKSITEFDVHDMRALMVSQKEALQNALDQNAMLTGQNSELRMHLSFMPVEYRDFVTNMQKNDNPRYRDQRRKKASTRMAMQKISRLHSKTPRWLTRPSNSAFAMRNMPRLVKLDEVRNEALSCGNTYNHTSSPKAPCLVNRYQRNNTSSPKMLRQVYHHQYLTRAPLRNLEFPWIRGLHQRVKHK